MIPKHRAPTHPGRILLKEFLEPMKLTQTKLAKDLKTNEQKINTLIKGKRGVSAEMAWLLSAYFKTSPEFWMNLQTSCELYQAKQEPVAA